jgi:hypothetical protein
MNMAISTTPKRSYAITADRTRETAIALVRAETEARNAKVERLRALRLEREAVEAVEADLPRPAEKLKKGRKAKSAAAPED